MDLKLVSRTLILAFAGGAFSLTAFAQWQWIDKDGRKVYSDRSPPPDILEKNILKRPGGARIAAAPVVSDAPAAAPAGVAGPAGAASAAVAAKGGASAPKLSGKDTQLEAKKKQAEDEEAAKKKAEEEKLAKAKADNCELAKKGQASMKSGVRIATTNAKGEREILDDSAKAAEMKRIQAVIDSDCK